VAADVEEALQGWPDVFELDSFKLINQHVIGLPKMLKLLKHIMGGK
jgi:hypothetical protein